MENKHFLWILIFLPFVLIKHIIDCLPSWGWVFVRAWNQIDTWWRQTLLWWLSSELHRNLPCLMLTNKRKGGEEEHLIKLWNYACAIHKHYLNHLEAAFPFYAITALAKMHLVLSIPVEKGDTSKEISLETLLLQFTRGIHRQMEALVLIPSSLCLFQLSAIV